MYNRSLCRVAVSLRIVFDDAACYTQIGGEAWWEQHDAVVSLSTQAQHNVATRSDEFVKEALVLHDKLRVLVFDLLAHEVQAER